VGTARLWQSSRSPTDKAILGPCISTSTSACAAASSPDEMLAAVGAAVGAVDASQPSVPPLSYNARLTLHYRAAKKEVLWGVCGRAAAAEHSSSSDSSQGNSTVSEGALALPVRNYMKRKS
jgi:hypothetical protein